MKQRSIAFTDNKYPSARTTPGILGISFRPAGIPRTLNLRMVKDLVKAPRAHPGFIFSGFLEKKSLNPSHSSGSNTHVLPGTHLRPQMISPG
jgi:hypothetical protein